MAASQQVATKPARDEKGRLLPGGTANPGGRARNLPVDLTQRLDKLTPEIIDRLAFWMRQDENPTASVAACKELLDRRFGKPAQHIDFTIEDARERARRAAREEGMTDDEAEAAVAEAEAIWRGERH